MTDLFTYWKSKTVLKIKVYEDQEKTAPLSLAEIELQLLGKKRITDSDEDAVFSLFIDEGLTLDEDEINLVFVNLSSVDTSTLPRTRTTTVYCELLALTPERQTLGTFELPVRPSLLEGEAEGS